MTVSQAPRGLAFAFFAVAAAAQPDLPRDPLAHAALLGDAAQVSTLLARGADPNLPDESGRTPLLWACSVLTRSAADRGAGRPDYLAAARVLVEQGADVNARDGAGRTALLAATEGAASEYKVIGADEPMVRLLLGHGATVNAQDREGWSPLLRAANLWADQPALIPLLLAHGADVNARLHDGRTALMLAARLGKTERLGQLLAAHADVDAADAKGDTALTVAALVSWNDASTSMLMLLLAKGANVNQTDSQGLTAADRAAEAGYLSRVELLLSQGANAPDRPAFLARARNYALRREIAEGSADSAQSLLAQGAEANFRDRAGRTLLMLAAALEAPGKTALLLEHGADVNAQAPGGETALMDAADAYQAATTQLLLANGANANAADAQGNTILMHAAASKQTWREERTPLIGLLLAAGAGVNRANSQGVTALMLMAGDGNPALGQLLEKHAEVDARDGGGNTALLYAARHFARGAQRKCGWDLLEHGASVDAANARGETALILAATQYEADAALLLLAKHASVNAQTVEGRTALMQAIDGPMEFDNEKHIVYSPAIAQALMEAGADVNARDQRGNTPLSLALQRGYSEMAAALRKAGAKQE